jgi:hypothetical protein
VVDTFEPGQVEADVVGGPAGAEFPAACGELPDQVREAAVMRLAAGGAAQDRDDVVGVLFPVREERGCFGIEENEAGSVGRLVVVGEDRGVEGAATLARRDRRNSITSCRLSMVSGYGR